VVNAAATDSIVLNTGTLGLLPSIWQTGSGRVSLRHTLGGTNAGITLAGGGSGTTLQIRGSGVGDVYIDTNIAQTGAASGLQINQTGTRSFFTGSVTRLGGSGSTFTGGVDLTAGNLMLSNVLGNANTFNPTNVVAATAVNSLGTTAGVLTINGANTSLQFDPLAISSGISPNGATGTLQVNNNVVLNSTLNLTGVAPATAPSGSIVGIFAGNIFGVGGINIAPTNGTLVYGFTGSNAFSGPVNIAPVGNTAATMLIGTANVSTGNLSGTTAITLTGNGVLTLNNVSGAATRLNTTTAPSLTLNRANFNLLGNSANSVVETLGVLTVNGLGSLTVQSGSGTLQSATLNVGSLNRGADGRGTLSITGQNLGSGTGAGEGVITFATAPTGAIGGGGSAGTTNRDILPYAIANSQNNFAGISGTLTPAGTTLNLTLNSGGSTTNLGLVRSDAVTGRLVPLNLTTEYATNLFTTGTTAPTAIMRLASTSALPLAFSSAGINQPTTINALVLDTNTFATAANGVSVGGSGTLRVGSGAILVGSNGNTGLGTITNPSAINLGGLDFGSATGYFHTNSNLTVNAPITGTNGVVKSLLGTLILNGNNSFTGGLALNSGPVQFSTDSNLGSAGGAITINSGLTTAINYLPSNLFASTSSGNVTVNRPITVGAAGGLVSVGLQSSNLTLPGTISGTGQFVKGGAGILTLSGTNNYIGNTVTFGVILAVQNGGSLGAASSNVILAGGTIQPNTTFSTSRDFLVTASSIIFTNGQDLTINGNLGSQQPPASTFTLFKSGLGILNLTGANTFNQAFQLGESAPTVRASASSGAQTAGTLRLSGLNGGINQAASVFAIGGGELVLDNSVDANSNRLPNATLTLVGGNVTLIGNALTPINEQIGAISISNTNNQYGGRLTIDSPTGAGATTLTSTAAFVAQPAPNFGTLFVRATNLGAASGDRGVLVLPTSAALPNGPARTNGLIASMVGAASATAADPTDFLTTLLISNASPNNYQVSIVPFTAYTPGGTLGAGIATLTYDVNTATTFTGTTSAANAIRIGAGGGIDLGGGTLTLTAGNILTTGGANTGVVNGTLAYAAGVTARFSVASGSDLTIAGPITGTTGGLNKLGGGTLTLNSLVKTTTGLIGISAGTLRLGGTGILPVASTPFISVGATLDLNNNNTTLGGLIGWGDTNLSNRTLTLNTTSSPIFAYGGGLVGSNTSALVKTGVGLAFIQTLAGNSKSFTGDVRVLAGTLLVNSTGALGTGTTPIQIGESSTSNQAQLSIASTVNSLTRDIIIPINSTPTVANTLNMGIGINTVSSNITMNSNFRLVGTSGATGGTTTMSGVMSGAGSLAVNSGNWSFTGNNTYAGGTTLDMTTSAWVGIGSNTAFGTNAVSFTSNGTNLRADGGARTIANQINLSSGAYFGVTGTNDLTLGDFNFLASGVTVNSGAILGGSGSVFGPLTVNAGGIIAPGTSPGILTVNGIATFVTGSIFDVELNGPTVGTGYDQLGVIGAIDLGSSNLLIRLGYDPTPSDFFYIVNNDLSDTVTNTFSGLAQGGSVFANFAGTPYVGLISYTGDFDTLNFVGAGNDVVLFGLTAVPERGSIALVGLIGLMIPAIRRFKRKSK